VLAQSVESGSYTGTGATLDVTIGWAPAFVVVVSTRTTGAATGRGVVFKSVEQSGANAFQRTGAGAITITAGVTITNTGFQLNTNAVVNNSGTVFHWFAFRHNGGATPSEEGYETGTYTGNGAASVDVITNSPPAFVWIMLDDTTSSTLAMKTSDMSGETCARISGTTVDRPSDTPAGGGITMLSNGFRAGLNYGNVNGKTYRWIARRAIAGASNSCVAQTFNGTTGTVTAQWVSKQRYALKAAVQFGTVNRELCIQSSTMNAPGTTTNGYRLAATTGDWTTGVGSFSYTGAAPADMVTGLTYLATTGQTYWSQYHW